MKARRWSVLEMQANSLSVSNDEKSTAAKFAGERQHRVIPNVGPNLPQENPTAFADAVWELASKKRWLILRIYDRGPGVIF